MGYGTPTIPHGITTRRALALLLQELGYAFMRKDYGHVDLERLPQDPSSWSGRLNNIEAAEKHTHDYLVITHNEFELHRADKHGANACSFCGAIDTTDVPKEEG